MPKPIKAAFKVELVLPPGVTKSDMAAYIADAVNGWSGSLPPDDGLFGVGSKGYVAKVTRLVDR